MAKYNITSAAAGKNPGGALKGYLNDQEEKQLREIDPSYGSEITPPQRGIPIERFGVDESAPTSEGTEVDYDDETFDLVSRLADELSAKKSQPAIQEKFSEPKAVEEVEFLGANQDYDQTSESTIDPLTAAQRSQNANQTALDEANLSNERLKNEVGEIGQANFDSLNDVIGETLTNVGARNPLQNPAFDKGTNPVIVSAVEKLGAIDPTTNKVKDNFSTALSFAVIDSIVTKKIQAEEDLQKSRQRFDEDINDVDEAQREVAVFDYEQRLKSALNVGLNTQQDADAILRTAEKALTGGGAPINSGQSVVDTLSPNEKSALIDSVFRDLTDRNFLIDMDTPKARQDFPDAPPFTWLINNNFKRVLTTLPDVVNALQGSKSKAPSNSPNPGGRSATDAGNKYKATGKSTGNLGLRWLAKVEKALDYYGTTAMQISTPTVNAEFNLLQDILNYNRDPKFSALDQNKASMNSALFNHVDPNKRLKLAISDHKSASFFKMDLNSLRTALNSSRPKGSELPYLENTGDLLKYIDEWNSGFNTDYNIEKQMRAGVDKFNLGVSDYLNPLFEASNRKGDAFFFHQELIGVNGRMRIADNTINPQTSPAFRGLITSTKVIMVDPRATGNNERTKRFKAMVARNLNLTTRLVGKDGKFVTKKKGGVDAVAEVKAEHLPRTQQRVDLFDLYFSTDPVVGKNQADIDYILSKRAEGRKLVLAANSLSGLGTKDSINSAINPEATSIMNENFSGASSIDGTRGSKIADRWSTALGLNPQRQVPGFKDPQNNVKFVNGPDISSAFDRENIAVALEAKKPDGEDGSAGKVTNEHKEGSIRMNTLLNLARFELGHPFRSDIVTELDGINNNFAILALLLGDVNLAKHSGLLNPNLEETGQIVSDGDMRDYIHGQAFQFFDDITESFFADNVDIPITNDEFVELSKIVLDSVDTADSGTVKLAWKDIIMQAGYGKDFTAFPEMFSERLSGSTAFMDKLKHNLGHSSLDLDPVQALNVASELVPFILKKSLNSLNDYTKLTKKTGTLASILKQDYVSVASSGFPTSMQKKAKSPLIRGHVDNVGIRPTVDTIKGKQGKSLEKHTQLDPFQIKRKNKADGTPKFKQEGRITFEDIIVKDFEAFRKKKDKDAKDNEPVKLKPDDSETFWNFLSNAAFAQGNRAPVLPIHAEDASVMVAVADYASSKNLKLSPKEKIWFYQVFDALMVDVDSYTDVPKEYNRVLVEQVISLDRYGQDLLELSKFKRNAIKTGDVEVALMLEKITRDTSRERDTKGLLGHLTRIQDGMRDAEMKLLNDLNILNIGNTRYKSYETYERRRQEILDKIDNLASEDRFKVKPQYMEALFKNFTQFHEHVNNVKNARKDVQVRTKDLYKQLVAQAKNMDPTVDYDVTDVGLGTHNAS